MPILPFLPGSPALWGEGWTPEGGFTQDALLHLLGQLGHAPKDIAQELGMTAPFIRSVCGRTRRSARVESWISNCLGHFGYRPEQIWGNAAYANCYRPRLPDVFGAVPQFEGILHPTRHNLVLLADCETSGPNAEKHRAVEVALLKVVFERKPEEGARILGALGGYHGLQDPGPNPVHPLSMKIHGIPLGDLQGQSLDLNAIDRVVDGCSCVIAHNASFDQRFFAKATPRLQGMRWLCSFRGIPWKALGYEAANLKALSKIFGFAAPGHRAPGDVAALFHLLNHALPDGQTVLAMLLRQVLAEDPR